MSKKKSNKKWYAATGIVVGIITAILLFTSLGGTITNTIYGRPDISNTYHTLIDIVNPTAIHDAMTACYYIGATYKETPTTLGCYNIPPNMFSASECTKPSYVALQQVCQSISGAKWVCTSSNVGCAYV